MRKKKKKERENVEFGNVNTEIPLPNSCWPGVLRAWSAQSEKKRKKKLWQTNCGNAIAEIGEKKNLWQTNCGNGIAEIGKKICEKLIVAMPLLK